MINKEFPWRVKFCIFYPCWMNFSRWCFLCSGVPTCSCYQLVNCVLYMCTFHSSMVCANAYVCNGPCTNTAWNYILPLFPFLACFLSDERTIVICGLQSLMFIKANWNSLVFKSYQKKNSYTTWHWKMLVCTWKFFWFSGYISWPSECYNVPPLPQPQKGLVSKKKNTAF